MRNPAVRTQNAERVRRSPVHRSAFIVLRLGERGAALIWVVGVLTLSLLVLFTLAGWLVAVHAANRRDRLRADARLLAENAVHLALAELNRNAGYVGTNTPEVQVAVSTPPAAAPETSPWFTLETTDANDWRSVTASVTLGNFQAGAGGTARAIYHPAFPAGLFATDRLDLRNLTTDSYDSRRGDYRASRDFKHGDIGTFGELRLRGECRIGGNARPGPGYALTIPPDVHIDGRTNHYPARYVFKAIEGKRQELKPLQVPMGKTTTLSGGAYWAENFLLTDTTRLVLQGPVVIFIPSSARIPPNALITQSQKALEVTLYVAGASVELYPPFIGALHAPKAAVTIRGQGQIFGAVTSRTITNEDKLIVHFDRSLPYLTRGSLVEFRLLGWNAGTAGPG